MMLRETVRCGTGDTAFPHVPRCPHRPRPTKATIHTRRLRVVLKGGAVVLRSWSCLGDRVATQMSVKYQIHTSAAPLRQRATEGGFIGTGGGRGADDTAAARPAAIYPRVVFQPSAAHYPYRHSADTSVRFIYRMTDHGRGRCSRGGAPIDAKRWCSCSRGTLTARANGSLGDSPRTRRSLRP